MNHIFDIIPRDVIKAWLDGKYDRSPQRPEVYDTLGWGLMLRGCYSYQGQEKGKVTNWGYALWDLEGGDLYAAGIRLFSNDSSTTPSPAYKPLLWRSDVCKLKIAKDKPYLMTIYRVALDPPQRVSDIEAPLSDAEAKGILDPPKEGSLCDACLRYLRREDFSRDWHHVETSENFLLGIVEVRDLEGTIPPRDDIPFSFKGNYRTIKSAPPAGDVTFTRIPMMRKVK